MQFRDYKGKKQQISGQQKAIAVGQKTGINKYRQRVTCNLW